MPQPPVELPPAEVILSHFAARFGPAAEGLQFQLSRELASTNINYRPSLRKALLQHLSAASGGVDVEDHDRILDLTRPPVLSRWCCSISHCTALGGFALIPSPASVGLDLEVRSRITSKIVSRVSTQVELSSAPEPQSLWVAKEAAFKSLFVTSECPQNGKITQPAILSDVRIHSWHEPLSEGLKSRNIKCFSALLEDMERQIHGEGLVWWGPEFGMAIFLQIHST